MRGMMRIGLALLVALALTPATRANEAAERFSFLVPNPPESTVDPARFTVTINRWSTDAERDQIAKVVAEGPAKVLDALRDVGAVGYLRWPGGLEYTLRYARRVTRSDGTTDVVLIADRPLWVWWNAGVTATWDHPYTVVQIRVDKEGKGEGRISSTPGIAADKDAGLVLSGFQSQPLFLRDVRRERLS